MRDLVEQVGRHERAGQRAHQVAAAHQARVSVGRLVRYFTVDEVNMEDKRVGLHTDLLGLGYFMTGN